MNTNCYLGLAVIVLLVACVSVRSAEQDTSSVLIDDVPHIGQKPDFCGEACAAMALQRLGHRYDQDDVFDQSGLAPSDARGCYTKELHAALTKIGFDTGKCWHAIQANRAGTQIQSQWQALHADLKAGIPTIICTRYDERPDTTEHFRLILGYDARSDEVIYHEPAERAGAYRRMPRSTMLSLWPLKYSEKTWSVIRLPLRPKNIRPRPRPPSKFTAADYTQHIMRLKKKLPGSHFHFVIEKPFIVVGDESPQAVERRAAGTIRWAVTRLKKDYFVQDPNHIIDIWLFRDKESYEKHTKALFNDTPTTPFGYYSPTHRALVMNISTGGGTLVHEIVHPFIASNFPKCPSWFNEGLASLYEQCGDRDGRIHGFTNWRLAGLQSAIQRGRLPSFKELCSTTTREFYQDPYGTNYGQARYLCYYLQQKGLLRDYYRQFLKNAADDPTGLETLAGVLETDDLEGFQDNWESYVLKLTYR